MLCIRLYTLKQMLRVFVAHSVARSLFTTFAHPHTHHPPRALHFPFIAADTTDTSRSCVTASSVEGVMNSR